MNQSSKQKGFSLLEVLVSVVVLSIGLLGVAALQISAVRYNTSAQLRSIAISQMSAIIDRLEANSTGLVAGYYNNVSGLGSKPSCTTCTSSQIAAQDIYQWNYANSILLPSGQGTIQRNGTLLRITIRWDNDRSGATGLGCSGNSSVDLTCLVTELEL